MIDIINYLNITTSLIGGGVVIYYTSNMLIKAIKNKKEKAEKNERMEVYEKYYMLDKKEVKESIKNFENLDSRFRSFFHGINYENKTDYTDTSTQTNSVSETESESVGDILDNDVSIDRVDLNTILKNIRNNHVGHLVKLEDKAKEMFEDEE